MDPVRRIALEAAPGALACDIPVLPGFSAGITLAAAGDMALSRDREQPWRARFLQARGIPRDRLYAARQVHSRRVLLIDAQPAAEVARDEADGLCTDRVDAVLSITVADCLPIFLADRDGRAFALVHSGWRGTGIAREALQLMRERFGSRAEEVIAVIGPGIGSCCYTVPQERAAFFSGSYGASTVVQGTTPRLDLREANVHLLREAGVREISVVTDCTSCSSSLGSFRRQGPAEFTLMMAWIGREGAFGG